MKKLTLTILFVIFLVGCKATKSVDKTRKEINTEQAIDTKTKGVKITEETQEGGKTSGTIIPFEERERNELGELKEMIQEIKDGAVTQRVIYRSDGSVKVECEVEALQRKIIDMYEKQEEERNKREEVESNKKKQEGIEIDNIIILYIVIGLTVAMIVAMVLVSKKINTVASLIKQ